MSTHVIMLGVLLIVAATGNYWSLMTYRGFPTTAVMGKDNSMIWASIKDPTPKNPDGLIYVWVYDPDRETTRVEELLHLNFNSKPRAYEIPYTKESAKELREAMKKKMKGFGVLLGLELDGTGDKIPKLKIQTIDPYEILPK